MRQLLRVLREGEELATTRSSVLFVVRAQVRLLCYLTRINDTVWVAHSQVYSN